MNHWFSSDWHCGHGNIIKYCNRPFMTDEESRCLKEIEEKNLPSRNLQISQESILLMDDTIIDNVNAIVKPNDILWFIGDFCFARKFEYFNVAKGYRNRINCKNINFIWGNHDDRKLLKPLFNECYDQVLINVNGQSIFLNHYAMRTWDKSHHGSYNLYGHTHGLFFEEDEKSPHLTLDVGVDTHNFKPWSFEEIKEHMDKKLPLWQEMKKFKGNRK